MKKIYLIFKIMLLLSIVFYSCKKETTNAVDDQIKLNNNALQDSLIRDSLRRAGGVIVYSINIVDGSDAGFSMVSEKSTKATKKLAAIQGAKVIAVQYGKTISVTDTAGLGIVTIKDLRIGTVSVRIQAANFTECSFIAQLTPLDSSHSVTNSDEWNSQRYVGTIVPLFPTAGPKMATISGVVTYQSDLTNVGREYADTVSVFGVIDVDNSDFVAKYMASYEDISYFGGYIRPEINYYGHIVKIAYNSIVFESTTNANGAYSLKVPATGDGLPIKMEISDVAVNQTLLLDTLNNVPVYGVQTVRTLFSSNYTPSTIPYVPAAYCTFTAPTGNGTSNQPTIEATATDTISESGIISITLRDPGLGYTQTPNVEVDATSGTVLTPATAIATIDANGRVSNIQIINAGVGYSGASVSLISSETIKATATPVVTYGVKNITIGLGSHGAGYNAVPPAVTVYSNSGTGAIANANMKGYVYQINVTAGGANYTSAPNVVINGGDGNAAATAVLTGTSVSSVNVTNVGSGFTSNPVISFVSVDGNGSGAAANAVLHYRVDNISIVNMGSGYLAGDVNVVIAAPPAANPDGVQASATATLGDGVLSGLDVKNPGLGYTADPVVTIAGGGASVNATATATAAGGQVTGFTITNPGVGYTGNPTVTVSTYQRAATATALCNSKAGQIIAINLTNNGEGYNVAPVVEFYYPTTGSTMGNGNGANAAATATISGGRVTGVTITDGGSGYYNTPSVRFRMPNVNQTATATLTLSPDGYVTGINLNNEGWGYVNLPAITITPSVAGMGSGASAIVTKMDSSRVTGVQIVNQGSGYLGKNNPGPSSNKKYIPGEGFSVLTAGGSGTTINTIYTLTSNTYIRDIYLGTGKRTIEQ